VIALLLGAIIHDFNHPGTSNAHEIKCRTERAVMHSDQSVLERHHLASAFKVLSQPGYRVLDKLSTVEYQECRALMIELVLYTDLSKHFDFIGRLKTLASGQGYKAAKAAHKKDWRSPFANPSVDAKIVLIAAIKFADLGHVCKPFWLHQGWVERVTTEFYAMGDREKALGVAVSPMCDRDVDTDIVKSQIGFLQFVCIPYYKVIADLVQPRLEPYRNCQENFWQWHKRRRMQDEKKAAIQLATTQSSADVMMSVEHSRMIRRGSGTVRALVDDSPRLGRRKTMAPGLSAFERDAVSFGSRSPGTREAPAAAPGQEPRETDKSEQRETASRSERGSERFKSRRASCGI